MILQPVSKSGKRGRENNQKDGKMLESESATISHDGKDTFFSFVQMSVLTDGSLLYNYLRVYTFHLIL